MKTTIQERKNRAAETLFLDVMCPIKKATGYLERIEKNEQVADLIWNEFQTTRIPCSRKQMMLLPEEERKTIIKKHVEEWGATVGLPSIENLVKLCDTWSCDLPSVYSETLTPLQIKKMLQMYVIGQDNYCEQLALAFYLYKDRLGMDEYESRNAMRDSLFVLGPSGSGKTYAIQMLCQLFNAPMILVHCNSLVQEGIVGNNFNNIFTKFYVNNKQNEETIKRAVVVFDEFDKLLLNGHFNERIMSEMLNIIDDKGEVTFDEEFSTFGSVRKITVPTNKMLFIFTGVCEGLEDVTRRRLNVGGLGYVTAAAKAAGSDWMEHVTPHDLEEIGFMPEIIGRIQTVTHTVNLTEEKLMATLDSELSSPLTPFTRKLAKHGIQLKVSESGKKAIAAVSYKNQLGVRGMKSVLYAVLRGELPRLLSEENKRERVLNINEAYVAKTLNLSL